MSSPPTQTDRYKAQTEQEEDQISPLYKKRRDLWRDRIQYLDDRVLQLGSPTSSPKSSEVLDDEDRKFQQFSEAIRDAERSHAQTILDLELIECQLHVDEEDGMSGEELLIEWQCHPEHNLLMGISSDGLSKLGAELAGQYSSLIARYHYLSESFRRLGKSHKWAKEAKGGYKTTAVLLDQWIKSKKAPECDRYNLLLDAARAWRKTLEWYWLCLRISPPQLEEEDDLPLPELDSSKLAAVDLDEFLADMFKHKENHPNLLQKLERLKQALEDVASDQDISRTLDTSNYLLELCHLPLYGADTREKARELRILKRRLEAVRDRLEFNERQSTSEDVTWFDDDV
ncbi:uncharacterized protein I303_106078 [Kwoniella dejecticola CBS 10117]|uniref:Uncharacterized protein n=1 Tax=Kwoniella dejecticola CBS 10117 TaxID=1296121 RepID=A0A1A6A185_9TREE|nr:uncharacterized protein I303_06098 [Kwoniella dejecticola CBS 10117]OBR83815.1 hypothetical protein I303_06098 [Kwoniella dejecticola CBS 10117]